MEIMSILTNIFRCFQSYRLSKLCFQGECIPMETIYIKTEKEFDDSNPPAENVEVS